ASSRDPSGDLPQSMGTMPQPQIGRSLPCDGSMLEGALTRLANELYAAPPGGAAGGLPPLAVGAGPNVAAAPESLGLEPAPNSQSLGAGGGTAAPAPPFPTTAGQQQSGVSLPGGHPPQTLQSVDDDKLQSVLAQSNISGVPN